MALSSGQKQALDQQIRNDPRVQQLVTERAKGSISGFVTNAELRQFGYDVPDNYAYLSGGGRLQAGLFQVDDKWDKILRDAAIGVMTLGMGWELAAANGATPTAATVTSGGATGAAPTAAQLGTVSALEHGTTLAVPSIATGVGSSLTKNLLNYGLPIGASIINGVIQAKAINSAADAQAEALDKALAAEKENRDFTRASSAEQSMYDRARYDESTNYGRNTYANYIKTLEPFRQTGTAANDRMGQILGLNFTPNSGTTYPQLADVADTPSNLSQQYRPLSTGLQGQLVTMVAPNGETSQVPSELVDHYTQLGARRA